MWRRAHLTVDQRVAWGPAARVQAPRSHLLLAEDSVHVVRAWFIGMNPQLNDDSPAGAIRDGRMKEALGAAKAFMSGG